MDFSYLHKYFLSNEPNKILDKNTSEYYSDKCFNHG